MSGFNRERAIAELVDNEIDTIMSDFQQDNDLTVLAEILEFGFKGYSKMTDEQLMQELTERDISYLFGENEF